MKPDLPDILQPTVPEAGICVRVIGCGGVGGNVVRNLVTLFRSMPAARIKLVLIDGDKWENSNGARSLLRPREVGINKARSLVNDLGPYLQGTGVTMTAVEDYVKPDNIARLVRSGDYCFVCVDSHRARKMISDYAYGPLAGPDAGNAGGGLADIVLINGGNDGVEKTEAGRQLRGTAGSVGISIIRAGREISPPITRFHPEVAQPRDKLPTEKSCNELQESIPQLAFANMAVALNMAVAFWLLLSGDALHFSELAIEIAECWTQPLDLRKMS
jgi:ThiF family